jgi:hypothetical protein
MKLKGVILMINFEKTYNKVKWSFLQQNFRIKGFSDKCRALIHSFVLEDSAAIKVNDIVGRYFETKKLRQHDQLS